MSKKRKLKKKIKRLEKRIEEIEYLKTNQSWITQIVNEYSQIQGRLFRLEQVYNLPKQ